jgi:hypothetical protein
LESASIDHQDAVAHRAEQRMFVHLAYIDDSGTDKATKRNPTAVVGAVLIPHESFRKIEVLSGAIAELLIPEDRVDSFEEFHAAELFGGYGVFEGIEREKRMDAISQILYLVPHEKFAFIYSALSKEKLSRGPWADCKPIQVAFRVCALGIEHWIRKNQQGGLVLMICDDSSSDIKMQLRQSFRNLRRKVLPPYYEYGDLAHIHDDMYFGSSKDSVGIQIADVCTWVIHRSLTENDVPHFYEHIAEYTVCAKIEPYWNEGNGAFLEYKP